jgi:hypothetical protein
LFVELVAFPQPLDAPLPLVSVLPHPPPEFDELLPQLEFPESPQPPEDDEFVWPQPSLPRDDLEEAGPFESSFINASI